MSSKQPWQYEIEINCLLRRICKSFSLEGKAMKCEEELMDKLNEVCNLYKLTKDDSYKKIFSSSQKRYDQILNGEFYRNKKLIKPKDLELDLANIPPEELEEEVLIWENAIGILE